MGVKEYWIIDPQRRQLLVYHFAKDSIPQMQELKGKRGLAMYDGELEIDLDEFVHIIERGF